ncbi:MAG: anthranilate synthase component I [Rivularia sp. T60_A2020_040]|nr:anthranilate synthase component I [Rivularia sp. T60_A2020_040]
MITELQPWYWQKLPLNQLTGSDVFASLFVCNVSNCDIATLLESPYPIPQENPQLARYSICAGNPRIIDGVPQMWTVNVGAVLPFLEQLLAKKTKADCFSPPVPFTGGWLGWLGYDVAGEIEALPKLKSDPLPFPVAFWYEPECFAVLDHWEQVLWLAASSTSQLDDLAAQLQQEKPNSSHSSHSSCSIPNITTLRLLSSQADYEAAVLQAKKYIQAGDIFQTNLSVRFETQTSASGWEIYQALQKINPSPFASYFKTPWGEVVSCSPERLVKLYEGLAQTRPIAGTRKRGTTAEEDLQLAQELLSDSKERAEHIMLVDLERNDLGRVCEWGSVKVDELLTIERYSHVMHLVSNITGNLRYDDSKGKHLQNRCTAIDLIRAMFPGGTITGCPKVRCMEIIEELEPVKRSLFYGSCGYLDRSGNLDLNILIRTLLVAPQANKSFNSLVRSDITPYDLSSSIPEVNLDYPTFNSVWGQVGAGIVADSNPQKEWYESLHKAQALLAALQQSTGNRE